ncbi:DUF2167 domain-containing protein [Chitinimonas sp.]|uniref:DUF2167 domain-containing protein n=1 Tax=Chitinimonas sp. TaxID=1934313 RepID=UPI002F954FAD
MLLRKRGWALVLAVASVLAGAEEQGKYSPHYGPYTQNIGSVAELQLRENFLSLDSGDTERYMEAMHNPGVTNAWYFAPAGDNKWFAIFEYSETGHVKDDEKIDADSVLKSIKEGTAEANKERAAKGWAPLNIIGWRVAPHYETDTKRLSYATLAESSGHQVINYHTKILGRTGVTDVTLVTDPESFDSSVAELKRELGGFDFKAGQGYNEFKSGDKVAEYGLAGLMVGGAAAVAAKTGFFKWIGAALAAGWKLILVGLAALGGMIKSLFSRKSQ